MKPYNNNNNNNLVCCFFEQVLICHHFVLRGSDSLMLRPNFGLVKCTVSPWQFWLCCSFSLHILDGHVHRCVGLMEEVAIPQRGRSLVVLIYTFSESLNCFLLSFREFDICPVLTMDCTQTRSFLVMQILRVSWKCILFQCLKLSKVAVGFLLCFISLCHWLTETLYFQVVGLSVCPRCVFQEQMAERL